MPRGIIPFNNSCVIGGDFTPDVHPVGNEHRHGAAKRFDHGYAEILLVGRKDERFGRMVRAPLDIARKHAENETVSGGQCGTANRAQLPTIQPRRRLVSHREMEYPHPGFQRLFFQMPG